MEVAGSGISSKCDAKAPKTLRNQNLESDFYLQRKHTDLMQHGNYGFYSDATLKYFATHKFHKVRVHVRIDLFPLDLQYFFLMTGFYNPITTRCYKTT